jgi:acyl-homoserine-lactone acylase
MIQRFLKGFVCTAAIAVMAANTASADSATLYRDTWGVPHIYADSETAGAYALGYATAEDRLADIYQNIHIALGTAAEHFGKEFVMTDMAMRMARNRDVCRDFYDKAPANLRDMSEAYVRGVEAYAKEHPEKVPDYGFPIEPWHTAAVGRAMILQWPLGTLMDELNDRKGAPDYGSNGWAVSPGRTAENCAIVMADPHLTWEHLAVFYEARFHGGDLHMNGFFLAGAPLVAIGHTEHVGWACTTGGPDTGDVFTLPARPAALGFQYQWEGEWKIPQLKPLIINVKGADKPTVIPSAYTELGPILAEPDFEKGVVYVGKTPYFESAGLFEQQYAMCMAKNADEFFETLRMNQFMEQNLIFGDRQGNIGYARVGMTPIRPEGPWDWKKPVPYREESAWLGLHDIKDLVWIMNPESGYLQNCNISPANMMVDSPLTPDKYPSYIYNVSWDKNNPRGIRTVDLLHADDKITLEKAKAIVMDVYDFRSEPWQQALRAAVEAHGDVLEADARVAADTLLAWNLEFDETSQAAPLMRALRLDAGRAGIDIEAVMEGKALDAGQQEKLLTLLADTVANQKKLYGDASWLVAWGEVQKVGRNGEFFPAGGADFGGGINSTETVRDVVSRETSRNSGVYHAYSGSMAALLMFMREEGIESYTTTPWGQSADPESPHHVDQSRELYSQRKMKPTWWKKAELLENVASEKVLTYP